jgi:non-specific serine/threonine protein kinase/serine/threonine-protein kinase
MITPAQEVDGRAAPKIIDFGVAKALTQRLTADPIFTRVGAVVGTPEYMSPEQARSFQDWISKFWQNCIGRMGDWLIELEVVKRAALTKRCILAALYPDGSGRRR